MAHMIPDTPPAHSPGSTAERAVYQALREQLGDDFFVYYGLAYLTRDRAVEGEVDFLILHRELGMLVLECKGFGVKRTGSGQWIRVNPKGDEQPLKESPFEQASGNVHDLVGELRRRLEKAVPGQGGGFPFVFGHAVVFPFADLTNVNLPLDANRRIVFGAAELDRLGDHVQDALSFWKAQRRAPAPLEPSEFKRFRKHALHPVLQLAPSLAMRLRTEGEQLVRLSEQQVAGLHGFLKNPRTRITGGAGTGKTVLALELARIHATEGRDVLLLCFNRALARHLDRQASDFEEVDGKVQARSFHQLCVEAFAALGRKPIYPEKGAADAFQFWNYQAPTTLWEALDEDRLPRWDAVVVDEAQDMRGDWWPIIETALRNPKLGYIAAFYDEGQAIFRDGCQVPDKGARFELTVNFRNTRRIAKVLGELSGHEVVSHEDCPEGEPVTVIQQEGPSKAFDQLEDLVERLVGHERVAPEAIVILTPHSRPNSLLRDRTELAGLPLRDDPLDRAGGVLHCSIGRFKGLESDVIILADIDPDDERCGRNERYVAASRARQLLYVFAKGNWLA